MRVSRTMAAGQNGSGSCTRPRGRPRAKAMDAFDATRRLQRRAWFERPPLRRRGWLERSPLRRRGWLERSPLRRRALACSGAC
jgi:hypothetical protein